MSSQKPETVAERLLEVVEELISLREELNGIYNILEPICRVTDDVERLTSLKNINTRKLIENRLKATTLHQLINRPCD